MAHRAAVSVVMPARNVARYVDEAVDSILRQTFEDFELVIRDDGSTDGTFERLEWWSVRDPRIRLFRGEQLGLAASSNWVVQQTVAPLVARMDSDDVARPDRLERQVEAMLDGRYALVGSLCDVIDESGRLVRGADSWRIVRRSWFAPFPHTSIMFRRHIFDAVGGYRSLSYCEDWDFFLRVADAARVGVIADALVGHRVTLASSSGHAKNRKLIEDSIDSMISGLRGLASKRRNDPQPALAPTPQRQRVDPAALIGAQSTALWAGGSPKVLEEMLRRGRLRPDLRTAVALLWALLAELSPASLRLCLKGASACLNLLATARIGRESTCEWRPGARFQAAEQKAVSARERSAESRQDRDSPYRC